jgi:hypothetical protein
MTDAELIKVQLEEDQRARRRDRKEPPVKWFEKVTMETEGLGKRNAATSPVGNETGVIGSDSDEAGEEEVWRIKEGKTGYWSRREDGNWDGVMKLW